VPLAVEVERTSSTLPIDEELFAALETALPEPPQRAPVPVPPQRPPVAASSDEGFVNLSEWLRDEEPPKNTRIVNRDFRTTSSRRELRLLTKVSEA